MEYSAIRKMAKLSDRPGIISFSAGAPNPETFPVMAIQEAASKVLASDGSNALQYGLTLGFPGLIEAVVDLCAWKGIPQIHHDNVAITNGSQQALDLLGRLFIDPGDVVFFELPSYIGAISTFRNLQAELVGVEQANDGIDTEDLVRKVKRAREEGRRPKLLYLIPNFQNPSGITLSLHKRQLVLELAEALDLLIIEDDPYGEICFDPALLSQLAPMKSFDSRGRVIYVSTFSKILAPGLRVGWILASPSIIERIDLAKQACDLCGSMLDQRIVAECWNQGIIREHLPRIRDFYRSKCEVMLDSLSRHMPAEIRWTRPEGGLFLWVSLPRHLDSGTLLIECVEKERVSYVIGQPFYVHGHGSHTLRLAFSKENEDNIALGVERLAQVFKSHLE